MERDTRPILQRLEDAAMLNVPERVRENLCMEAKGVIRDLVASLEYCLPRVHRHLADGAKLQAARALLAKVESPRR
jgi:hypothetical protein